MPVVGISSSLDSVDYDPIDHLNAIFASPSSLSFVSRSSRSLRRYQNALDSEISELVVQQSISDVDSVHRIQTAKEDLVKLFQKVEGVRERAIQTEQTITEMTAEIKRLDNTKKNLTLSMTALKRLQMLTTAYEQLRGLSSSRQYRECAQLLQAVIQLMAHFRSYRSIDQIATLGRNVSDVQRELLEQVCEDFELAFAKGEVAQRKAMLAEACLVMDALGENARARLITWYCNTQLREYRQVFRGSDEAASLDNITRRYSWFKRLWKTYDDQHAALFPASWRADEMLANAFCEGTRDDFKGILAKSVRKTEGPSLDINLLLSCLQETLEFEHGLERKFINSSRLSMDTMTSESEKMQPFGHLISEAFEPYLSIWVEAQDKQLASMMPKYRQQSPLPADEEFSSQMVIASSTELFNFYRQTFAQCAKLSTGLRLVELSKVFAKYLDRYAQQVLLYYISERPTRQTPSRIPSTEDLIAVLNTADYCYHTSTQLEEKIKSRIDGPHRDSIDLQTQADAFMGVASAVLRGLVRRVEVDLEPAWREMRNTGLSKLQMAGDQSSYVAELISRMNTQAKVILEMLHKAQYARAFCDNVAELLASSFALNMAQCRPITEIAAEQLHLDLTALTMASTHLLNLLDPTTAPSAAIIKRTSHTFARVLPLLKTLQVQPSPPEALIRAYLVHMADASEVNFRKVLELKGIRKAEQGALVELFNAHKGAKIHEGLAASNAFLSALLVGSSGSGGVGSVSVGVGGMAISQASRFDPAGFGSAVMAVARDGVDRLGTPVLAGVAGVTGASGSRGMSPATGEESGGGSTGPNLKNLGKFFKRDLGSFGGRFAKGEGSV